jgi:hypothetical protein
MPGFAPPPVGNHVHVVDPQLLIDGERFGRSHCAHCGYSLEALLETQPVVEIVRRGVPLMWSTWRSPRREEVLRG